MESIVGQSFEEYCEINIFDPLGMAETSWHFEDMDESNVAMPYEWMPGWEEMGHYFIPYYPSAQLRSNINELSSFLSAYMENWSGLLNDEPKDFEPKRLWTKLHQYACDPERFLPIFRQRILKAPETFATFNQQKKQKKDALIQFTQRNQFGVCSHSFTIALGSG